MTEKQKGLYKKLLAIFWINLIVIISAFLVLLYQRGMILDNGGNLQFEQYSIIFTLIGIPAALKIFHSKYKKMQALEEAPFLEKLFSSYMLRIAILDAVILLNLAGIYSFNSQNAVYMTIITIFALFFCYPGKRQVANIKEDDTEN